MRTLLVTMLLLSAPAALAGSAAAYAMDRDHRPPTFLNQPDLVGPARSLDRSATRLYADLRSRTGRSELTSRARALADASSHFRRLAERRASHRQLQDAYRRTASRYADLERRLDNKGRHHRDAHAATGLERVNRALAQAGHALQRYAYDQRDARRQDRYALDPRPLDPRGPQWYRQRGLDAD